MLDQVCRQVKVQGGVDFIGQNWVDPMGPGSDGRANFRDRNLERHQGTRTKIRLGLGRNISKIAKNITQLFDCERGPAWAVKVESNRARCDGSRSQTRRNEARCSGAKRSSNADEGEAVAVAAARGEAITGEIEVTAGGEEEKPGGLLSC